VVSLESPTLVFLYLDPSTCTIESSRSPNLHINTQMTLMDYANCVVLRVRGPSDTIVQVQRFKYQNLRVRDQSNTTVQVYVLKYKKRVRDLNDTVVQV
jgi:hypothetical protein